MLGLSPPRNLLRRLPSLLPRLPGRRHRLPRLHRPEATHLATPGKVSRFRRRKNNQAPETPEKPQEPLPKPDLKSTNGTVGAGTRTKVKVKVKVKTMTRRGRGRPSKESYSGAILVLRFNDSSDSETTETSKSGDTHSTKTTSLSTSESSDAESQISRASCGETSIVRRKPSNHNQNYNHEAIDPRLDKLHYPVWDTYQWVIPKPGDLKPKEWDFIEALRFHEEVFSVYQPKALIPGLLTHPLTADILAQMKPSNRYSFISTAIGFQLALTCRRSRIYSPSSSGPAGRLWELYFHYVGLSIQSVNQDLVRGVAAKGDVLWGINGLLFSELFVPRSTNWRPHVQGFISFINLCGGLRPLLDGFYDVTIPVLSFVMQVPVLTNHTCTLANTTSPCYDQIAQVSLFDDDDLQNLYSIVSYPSFPYPIDLFLAVVRINRIRQQMGSIIFSAEFQSEIDVVLDQIEEFNPEAWIERYNLPDSSKLAMAADIFQSSVALYGMLSLLPLNNLPPTRSELLSLHHNRLLQRIDLAMQTLEGTDVLIWPLIVAGVASQSPELQSTVSKHLSTIEKEPLHIRSAGGAIDVLNVFWASGNTSWDDCFDRSYFFLS
ncbi:Phomenoic acid biosynthesis cluster-specific transcriptional regulator-like protein [Cladobotryum mycophilum]|uniref:Phomenoic acid biosynthesis cluster-specific transcriptional regulator-like protein n=1 Tax=Cladobotryum mycophilum TaxID=491253 RepID=A0ABR0SB98_9HYPO